MSPSDLPVIRRGQDPNDPVAGLNADWILSPKRRSEEVAQWEALLQQRQNGAVATHLELDLREGGPGSGNWGHAGIPGSRGGSMPGGGHSALGVGRGASDEEKKEAVDKRREEWEEANIDSARTQVGTGLEGLSDEELAARWANNEGPTKAARTAMASAIGQDAATILADRPEFGHDRVLACRDYVAGMLSEDAGASRKTVGEVILAWNDSSNDHNPNSLQIQEVVAEKFSTPLSPWQQQRIAETSKSPAVPLTLAKQDTERIMEAQYKRTQQYLADKGLAPDDVIELSRGTAMPRTTVDRVGKRPAIVSDNALISVSWSPHVARAFASWDKASQGDHVGVVQKLQVRVRDIVSTPVTGLGHYNCFELTILGRGSLATMESV